MFEFFFNTFRRLLLETNYPTHRYLYDTFNLKNRITGLIGPRGTGKTTLLLQYIKNHLSDQERNQCIYVSMDNIYFSNQRLLNFVRELYEVYGIKYFFLDEIHKYSGWEQELKNIYDSYPEIKLIFSGSSSIDLIKGSYDLSRRGVIYRLHGLSFREFLWFKGIEKFPLISYESLLTNKNKYEEQFGKVEKINGHFRDYLKTGYYPFFLEDELSYGQKLFRIIEKTIYEDIPNHYKLKTENLLWFKKILAYVANISPGELNRNNISRHMGLDNKTVQNYLSIMSEVGLLRLISTNKSGSGMLKKAEKIYLNNANLYQSIMEEIGYTANKGSIREIFFITMLNNSGHKIFYSPTGDFEVEGLIYEIGGRNKNLRQIKSQIENARLVKDDILFGGPHEIPLYLFGFLY